MCHSKIITLGQGLEVTDTNNGVSAEVTIYCEVCPIDVVKEQFWRSRWIPLPGIITIVGWDTDFTLATKVNFESTESPLSIIKAGKLILPGIQTIQQFVIIMPSILTGIWDDDCEKVIVSVTNSGVCDFADTIEICLLPFPLDLRRARHEM